MLEKLFVLLIGNTAAVLTTVGFLPQAWRVVSLRNAFEFSWYWLGTFGPGNVLWLIYGLATDAVPIVLGQTVTLPALALITTVKALGPERTAAAIDRLMKAIAWLRATMGRVGRKLVSAIPIDRLMKAIAWLRATMERVDRKLVSAIPIDRLMKAIAWLSATRAARVSRPLVALIRAAWKRVTERALRR